MAIIFGLKMPVFYLMLLGKDFTLFNVGLLAATTTISAIIFEVPFGSLADKIGRKKVFLLGELVAVFAAFGFWLLQSFEWIFVVMILNGLSKALVSGSLDALFVEQFNAVAIEKERTQYVKHQSTILSYSAIGLGVSTILAGFIPLWFQNFSDNVSYINFYDMNFIIMGFLTAFHMLLTYFVIEESAILRLLNTKEKKQGKLHEMKDFISKAFISIKNTPILLILFLLQFIFGATFMSLDNLWQPKLALLVDISSEIWLFGLLSSLSFFAMAIGQKLSSKVLHYFNYNYKWMLLSIQLLMGISFICLAVIQQVHLFFIFYMLMLLCSGLSMAPILEIFHENIKEEQRSTMLSVRSLFNQLGATLGALLGGLIAAKFGIQWAWTFVAFILLISVAIYLLPAMEKTTKALYKKK